MFSSVDCTHTTLLQYNDIIGHDHCICRNFYGRSQNICVLDLKPVAFGSIENSSPESMESIDWFLYVLCNNIKNTI